jgi:hypothetical protein
VFEIPQNSTLSCSLLLLLLLQAVKLVPRPDHKDEYDTEDSYGYKKDKKKNKVSEGSHGYA